MSTPEPNLSGTILVADDEESIRWVLERACAQSGHSVVTVPSGAEALAALRSRPFDLALVDIRMPDVSGLDVLSRAREEGLDTLFIVMTAQNTMANAIEATKRGAYDYLTKPFDLEQVAALIARALSLRRLTKDLERLRAELKQRHGLVIGRTPAMQAVSKVTGRVAPTDATVLIQGETGTGKELVANTIHYHSDRRGPFVAINCSAIPNELLESELFGYERGAFTGAVERRIGKFEAAAGGTLFLDEIAEMDLSLQAKLLRFVQTGTVRRVGGSELIRVDARIVCATNRDPFAEVEAGRFRADLFYRLHVLPIALAPLRARPEDVMPLALAFLRRFAAEEGRAFRGFTAEAEAVITACPWPGNVRQLENAIRRTVVLHDGSVVTPAMLPPELTATARLQPKPQTPALPATILPFRQQEQMIIEAAVAAFDGNVGRAAAALDISPSTIYRKRQEWTGRA